MSSVSPPSLHQQREDDEDKVKEDNNEDKVKEDKVKEDNESEEEKEKDEEKKENREWGRRKGDLRREIEGRAGWKSERQNMK